MLCCDASKSIKWNYFISEALLISNWFDWSTKYLVIAFWHVVAQPTDNWRHPHYYILFFEVSVGSWNEDDDCATFD